MTCPDGSASLTDLSRASVERPSKGDLEMTVHALHGIFWALNMIVGHKAADGIAPERQLAEGVDGLILAGRLLTEEVLGLSMSHIVRWPILVAALGSPCPYCGMPMLGDREQSRDHIKPRSRRHPFRDNQAIVCCQCNQAKGSLSLGRWLNRLKAAGDPRAEHVAAFVARLAPASRSYCDGAARLSVTQKSKIPRSRASSESSSVKASVSASVTSSSSVMTSLQLIPAIDRDFTRANGG